MGHQIDFPIVSAEQNSITYSAGGIKRRVTATPDQIAEYQRLSQQALIPLATIDYNTSPPTLVRVHG
jgi:hypothetical protein